MARPRYGVSPWSSQPRPLPTYPRLDDDLEISVAIVGGGLTGAATAYAFAAAGVRVVLLEAGRVAGGGTLRSPGLALSDAGPSYLEHEQAVGRKAARAAWQSTRRAALELGAAIRRLSIRCDYDPLDAVVCARTPEEWRRLQRDRQARTDAGLDVAAVAARGLTALGVPGPGGLRTRGHARLDPVRAAQGFARAAAVRGAGVFERSAVTRVRATRSGVEVTTAKGLVRAGTVVLATGEPTRDFRALERHFTALETYAVLTPVLNGAARTAIRSHDLVLADVHEPPHRLSWTGDGRMLWTGADQPRTPDRGRDKVLVQRTGQLMYELSLAANAISGTPAEFGWDAAYSRAADGIPFIGPHRNYPRHLFAYGQGTNLANAFLASRILLRHYQGAREKEDEAFGFARLPR